MLLTNTAPTATIEENSAQKMDNRLYLWKKYYSQDCDGDTLLHEAIRWGDPKIAEIIIRIAPSAEFLDTPNDNAETPLHLAVVNSQFKTVRKLLESGCEPSPRNHFGDSPLHIACRNGDLRCVTALLEPGNSANSDENMKKLDLEQWNYTGQTCVHVASINGHIDILRLLCQFGADINAREGLMGYTPLHFAVEKGDESLVNFLLRECKLLDVSVRNYGGLIAMEVCPVDWTHCDSDDSDEESVLERCFRKLVLRL